MLIAMCAISVAHAEDKPWAVGVSKDKQKAALALFTKGNTFFEEAKYTEAIPQYEKALGIWDHPSIRFNLSVCLINIRQPLVAWDHLQVAIKFGDAPLGKRLFAEAMTYKALLEESLAELDVSTDQPEVKVELDGRELFVGTNKKVMRLLAGRHQLVATRAGYDTVTKAIDLPPGRTTVEKIELQVTQVKTLTVTKVKTENYERRWSWWVPWSFAGAGIAFALTGTAVYLGARTDMRAYDAKLAAMCPIGCTAEEIPQGLKDDERSARRRSGIGIGLWAAGGAVAIGAGVMAILNRPRKVESRPVITPVVSAESVGAILTVGF